MKKLLWISILLLAIVFSLAACDEAENNDQQGGNDAPDAPVHAHVFGEWATVKEPARGEEGLQERLCECGERETQPIEALASVGLEYALNEDGKSYSVLGMGTCTDTELIIPATYEGYPVTAIAEGAFKENTSITSLKTGKNTVTIERYAFQNCTSLEILTLADGIISVAEYSFDHCSALHTLIGGKTFKEFPLTAFYYCNALATFEIDAENPYYTSIDGNCYNKDATALIRYGAGKTATHFEIPDSVTTINGESLYASIHLVSVTIPKSVTYIGSISFNTCISLTDVYYTGSEEEWAQIEILHANSDLLNATMHYNYVPEE